MTFTDLLEDDPRDELEALFEAIDDLERGVISSEDLIRLAHEMRQPV